jgi:hypothetical protein
VGGWGEGDEGEREGTMPSHGGNNNKRGGESVVQNIALERSERLYPNLT